MTRQQVLRKAVRTAIAAKCDRKTISVPHWAETYSVTQKAVREAWEMELTKLAPNSVTGVDGK
jgi:hypothetical protein